MAFLLRYLLPILLVTGVPLVAAGEFPVSLLQDSHFQRGVRVIPPAKPFINRQQSPPAPVAVCLPLRDCSLQPAWQLQQWANAQDIAAATAEPDGWWIRDATGVQKRLQIAARDQQRGDILLEMNGRSEFAASREDRQARYLPDLRRPWPHWLLSQQLDSGRLSGYRELQLHGEAKLLFDHPQRAAGFDSAVHAARLLLAITVRNRLTGDYFWITLPLYDDRYPHTGFGCQKCLDQGERCYTPQQLDDPGIWRCPEDRVGEQWWRNEKPGTARMIFRLPTRMLVQGELRTGDWITVKGDLMPYVQAGIEAVRQREQGRRFPVDLFFYELGLFSLGWEITGFNHVAAQLRGWQLDAVR